MIRGGQEYQFVKDHLGSVKLVVRVSDGAVVQNITYDEFGRVLNDTNPGFQPFGFAGGVYDAQTGLVKFGVRDYDGEVGRWLTKDPILFDGGDANLYGYVLMDPVNWVDPNGEVPVPLLLGLISGGISAAGTLANGGDLVDVAKSFGIGFCGGALSGIGVTVKASSAAWWGAKVVTKGFWGAAAGSGASITGGVFSGATGAAGVVGN